MHVRCPGLRRATPDAGIQPFVLRQERVQARPRRLLRRKFQVSENHSSCPSWQLTSAVDGTATPLRIRTRRRAPAGAPSECSFAACSWANIAVGITVRSSQMSASHPHTCCTTAPWTPPVRPTCTLRTTTRRHTQSTCSNSRTTRATHQSVRVLLATRSARSTTSTFRTNDAASSSYTDSDTGPSWGSLGASISFSIHRISHHPAIP
jgi:hypothetical protein